MLEDHDKAAAIERNFRTAGLTERETTMLEYVVKLTHTPSSMVESDVQSLRARGFSDAEILDICQVAAYYAYANRLVDGLGVELEPYWSEDDD